MSEHVTMSEAPLAVHFGAGNIGRGFVGSFLHQAGYRVVFVDVVKATTDALDAQSSYKVIELGTHETTTKTVTNYTSINTMAPRKPEESVKEDSPEYKEYQSALAKSNEAVKKLIDSIAVAKTVTCSVGPGILKFIAGNIAKGLAKRSSSLPPAAVIACENMINNTTTLAGFIKDPKWSSAEAVAAIEGKAVYANSAVDRIVPNAKGEFTLDVQLEQYHEWVVESTPFVEAGIAKPEETFHIPAITWVANLDPYIERKLYTVNTSHATAAYYGYNRGKPTIHEAMADANIRASVAAAISETAAFIVKKHGVSQEEQEKYKNKILDRIANPNLDDSVERVGRDPLRKLGRHERLIGPAASLAELGMETKALLEAAEMAFRFQKVEGDEPSVKLASIMESQTPEEVVKEICGLEETHVLFPKVKAIVEKVQKAD
ncbi:mannitol-1-phosphate 5-dehydrogenase [Xylariaceae sp. FL0255]|nr:mannitol-1-phosphate 5-dehydrogenase [Xylariaceae sp. FL0255]